MRVTFAGVPIFPGVAVCAGHGREVHLGENDGLMEPALNSFNLCQQRAGRKVAGQRIVLLQTDGVERVPELEILKLITEVGRVGQRSGINPADTLDPSANNSGNILR